MNQDLSDVYANVVDFLANSTIDPVANCGFIQNAIDSRTHVFFPGGTYRFAGILEFNVDEQRCTFLAGAILEPADNASYVRITGTRQTITGMRVEAPVDVYSHSPLVEIHGASGLLMQDLQVSVTRMAALTPGLAANPAGPQAAVRVMYLTECKFIGGRILGSRESGTIGLWLAPSYNYDYANTGVSPDAAWIPGEWSYPPSAGVTAAQVTSGAYEVGAVGLKIEAFGWGVRIGCICDNPNFLNCSFVDNVDGAVIVRDDADMLTGDVTVTATQTIAKALTLVGCRMTSGASRQYVEVQAPVLVGQVAYSGGCIKGGVVIGCSFGPTSIDLSGITGPKPAPDPADPAPWIRWADPAKPLPASAAGSGAIVVDAGADLVAAVALAAPQATVAGRQDDLRQPSKATAGEANPRSGGQAAGVRGGAPAPGSKTALSAGDDACIFRIGGAVLGVVVSGCRSESGLVPRSVWNITDEASLTQSCDMFNAWAEAVVATGQHAYHLIQMTANESAELALTAHSLRFDSESLGFFSAAPAGRGPGRYRIPGRQHEGDRWLQPLSVERVLAQLLFDLAELGIVRRRLL